MPNHRLVSLRVPVPRGLCSVNDLPHLLLFLVRKRNLPRGKVVGEPMSLGRAWDRNHALSCNPRERNLAQTTSTLVGKLLDLVGDRSVLVEGLSLEFGNCRIGRQTQRFDQVSPTCCCHCVSRRLTRSPEVIGSKVIGRLEGKVFGTDKPAMSERAVRYVSYAELAGRVEQAIGLVQRLKSRVLGLERIDLGNYGRNMYTTSAKDPCAG